MTQDVENVQPGTTSGTGEVSPGATTLPEGEVTQPQQQPLTEERIQQLLQEVASVTEAAKREIQSAKDKGRAEVEQALTRAQLAEETLAGVKAEGGLDSETTELAQLRAKDKVYRTREAQTGQMQRQAAFDQAFQGNMNQFITSMGIDPGDKRIDWGSDKRDYLTKQQAILASVVKIQKENAEAIETKLKKELDDKFTQLRKEAGFETHDTSTSAGVGGGDAEFLKKFGAGEVPYTKENVERANKIINK